MLLDLFITHWTEPWEVGRDGIRMLSMQRLADWSKVRVTIVHDGSEKFPDEYFAECPFKVNQVCLPHGGIAKARNWCIEHSDAKWIKWNDWDDTFASLYALYDILNVLDTDNFDLLWFDLLWQDHERLHMKTDREPVFVHNKVFRRKFLTDNEIRFNEELTWCEDSAFLAVVEMEIDHKRIGKIKCDRPIYLYSVRDGSLCNRPEIKFQNLQSFFKRHCYVADEFLKRGHMAEYNTMIVRIMADSYYTLNKAPGIEEDKSGFEKTVWDYYDGHREFFRRCTPEDFDLVMKAVNRERFDGGPITKQEFLAWIDRHERGE
jgi:hypothetical protein